MGMVNGKSKLRKLLAVSLCTCFFTACSTPALNVKPPSLEKPPSPTMPKKLDTQSLILRELMNLKKRAKRDVDYIFSNVEPLTLVAAKGKGLSLRTVKQMIEQATGYKVTMPATMLNRYFPSNFVCFRCSVPEVLRKIESYFDVAAHIDVQTKEIVFTDEVTVVYRLPLLGTKHKFHSKVGTTESGGGSGSQSSGTAPLAESIPVSKVSIESDYQEAAVDAIKKSLEAFAKNEKGVKVIFNEAQGVVTIVGKPSKVNKVKKYLDTLVADLKYQIEFDVTILQVELDRSHSRGIDWSKLFKMHPRLFTITGSFGLPSGSGGVVMKFESTRSANNVLFQFLNSYGKVKVISRPKFVVQNGFSAFFSSGKQVPYVQQIERQYYGDTNEEVITPTMAVAHSGLFFGIKAKIIDYDEGSILVTFSPEIATIVDWRRFKLSSYEYQNPVVEKQNFITRAIVNNGYTLLVGGIRVAQSSYNAETTGIPFLENIAGRHQKDIRYVELVVLLTPRIIKGVFYTENAL